MLNTKKQHTLNAFRYKFYTESIIYYSLLSGLNPTEYSETHVLKAVEKFYSTFQESPPFSSTYQACANSEQSEE